MGYEWQDHYFKKAKKENYAARSAFKLEEIDQKVNLLNSGDRILDLGAAPGSWSQYASKKIGPSGKIVGIDLQDVNITLPNALFVKGDILEMGNDLENGALKDIVPAQTVLSDMAPKTTGIKLTDQLRSLALCEMALWIAKNTLAPGGNFVCKIFSSGDTMAFQKDLRNSFEKVKIVRPKSTRKESKEVFFVAQGFKANH